jgi:heat-inducible transcriptional repressor
MDQRLETLLTQLVEDYIESAEPIGSAHFVKTHDLDVSSATIRNCFAELEEDGFLIQPHTSAGRIPTEQAFHWYADRSNDAALRRQDEELLVRAMEEGGDERMKSFAKACVRIVGTAALVGSRRSDTYYTGLSELFAQPEFQDWTRVISIGSVLDDLDGRLNRLRSEDFRTPVIRLGRDCPFGNACGSVMLTIPDSGLLVILGPMRMPYRKAKHVLNKIVEFTA